MGWKVRGVAVGAATRRRRRVPVWLAIVVLLVTASGCDDASGVPHDARTSAGPASKGPSAPAGPTPGLSWPEYLDDLVELLRAAHPDGDTVDWSATRAELQLDEVASPVAAYLAASRLVAALDDPHSGFSDAVARRNGTGGGAPPAGPSGELREGGVAYVELPASGRPGDEGYEHYVETTRELLDQHHDACGWIIDLRNNTGGDPWVMLQGIAPLLGDGMVLEAEDRRGTQVVTVDEDAVFVDGVPVAHRDEWALPDLLPEGTRIVGELAAEGVSAAYAPPAAAARVPDGTVPVAVLVGQVTVSGGEITAIALQGRPGPLRTFGAATLGRPTGVTSYELVDGSQLRLTTAVMSDRTGTAHRGSLRPDEPDDTPERAAQAWLQDYGCA